MATPARRKPAAVVPISWAWPRARTMGSWPGVVVQYRHTRAVAVLGTPKVSRIDRRERPGVRPATELTAGPWPAVTPELEVVLTQAGPERLAAICTRASSVPGASSILSRFVPAGRGWAGSSWARSSWPPTAGAGWVEARAIGDQVNPSGDPNA